MKTVNDIIMYISSEWFDYLSYCIERLGVSADTFELSNTERTALEMYRIAVDCFT